MRRRLLVFVRLSRCIVPGETLYHHHRERVEGSLLLYETLTRAHVYLRYAQCSAVHSSCIALRGACRDNVGINGGQMQSFHPSFFFLNKNIMGFIVNVFKLSYILLSSTARWYLQCFLNHITNILQINISVHAHHGLRPIKREATRLSRKI